MDADPARVKSLFLGASDLPSPEGRAAYLDRECGGEPDLRARVEALLAVENRAGPVPEPEGNDLLYPTSPAALGATLSSASETLHGSRISAPEAGLATVGATGAYEPEGTLAEVASTAGTDFTPGRVIAGRYTLLGILGEGGMGTVYLAEQTRPVKRQVALKLIRPGMDSRGVLARFDAERQALAMMDHPNIARVYDGGATEAHQPFFVMEFVHGVPITDYCDHHRLSVDARLRLFVAVCQAVQHAHQKGVIHRDLKPSNVMVTEVDGRATPKVIDFGVAKATGFDLTDQSLGDTGAIVGTPTYMSPEQADPSSMDIDTRTDVYALGVILYELLAGSTPLDATQFKRGALLEMLRMVREVDPSKPSTKVSTSDALPGIAANRGIAPGQLKRELAGDLDWIVMKALEKDRTRRYETANGFGADILRHLASEPVLAAPPSRSYRVRKFVRKHRAGVLAASLVLVALVAGIAGTTLGLIEARRQETRANERAEGERLAKQKALAAAEEEKKAKETVEAVLGFVENKVFAAARPEGQAGGLGYNVSLADAITAALPAIEKGFPGKPLTEARLRRTIGMSFLYLGKPGIAAEQNEAARSLYSRHLGPDHPDTLRSMGNLAGSYDALGRQAEALKLREETLALTKAKLGPDHPDTLGSMNNLAISYAALGRHAEALKLREETLALYKAKLGPDHPDTLRSMSQLAMSYTALGRHEEALKLYEETLALRKAKLGPDHPDTLWSMYQLASSYLDSGRTPEAILLLEKCCAGNPQDLFLSLKVAALRAWFGQEEEYAANRRRALALAKGTNDVILAERATKLSSILPSSDKAELEAALVLGRMAAKPGEGEAPYRPWRLLALGMAEYRGGDDPACEEALLAAEEAGKDIPQVTGTSAFYRAMSLHRRGRLDEARTLATEAAAKMKPLPADEQNPLAGDANHDDLILWLAYKEAKALIGFDAPPAAPAKPDGK